MKRVGGCPRSPDQRNTQGLFSNMDVVQVNRLLGRCVAGWGLVSDGDLLNVLCNHVDLSLSEHHKRVAGFDRANNSHNTCFTYIGRECFRDLVSAIHRTTIVLHVTGATGCGKTHLLAAYVIYEQIRTHMKFRGWRRIVYIPSCSVACGDHWFASFRDAVALAFLGDMNMAAEVSNLLNWDAMYSFCDRLARDSLLFVLDDYDLFMEEPLTEGTMSALRNVNRATHNHSQVRGVSARVAATATMAGVHVLPPRLSEPEWNVWVRSRRFALFNLPAGPASDEKYAELVYLTGRNPLVMALLCSYPPTAATGIGAIDDAIAQYQLDSSHDLGGARMASNLRAFMDNLAHKSVKVSNLLEEHIELMQLVLRECAGVVGTWTAVYDPRYIVREDNQLKPLCGFVADAWSALLTAPSTDKLRAAVQSESWRARRGL
jgi:hypothetical protein